MWKMTSHLLCPTLCPSHQGLVKSGVYVPPTLVSYTHISLLSILLKHVNQVDFKSTTVFTSTLKEGKLEALSKYQCVQILGCRLWKMENWEEQEKRLNSNVGSPPRITFLGLTLFFKATLMKIPFKKLTSEKRNNVQKTEIVLIAE